MYKEAFLVGYFFISLSLCSLFRIKGSGIDIITTQYTHFAMGIAEQRSQRARIGGISSPTDSLRVASLLDW